MSAVSLPQHVGRYKVLGLSGSGGFATVYEGFDERLDARVAIKVLADNWSHEPEVRRRFRNEAVLLRRLGTGSGANHLIEVFDIDETESGQLFFVMGWADRGTLAQRAKGQAWPMFEVKRVVDSLAASLGQLHTRSVLHRDIKPSNLLIRSDGNVEQPERLLADGERLVLADLGLAKDTVDDTSLMSIAGGTPRFMAPERHIPEAVLDHRVDIYSATQVIQDLARGRSATAPVGQHLQAALHRGLASNPAERPDSMAEWATMFRDAIIADDEAPTQRIIDPPTQEPGAPIVRAVAEPQQIASSHVSGEEPAATPSTPAPASPAPPAPAPPAPAPVVPPQPVTLVGPTPSSPPSPEVLAPASVARSRHASVQPDGPSQPDAEQSSRVTALSPKLVGALLALVAVVGVGFFLGRGDSSPVRGPSEIQSGESARYSVEDAVGQVTWIDPAGQAVVADALEVTGRLPGRLMFSAIVGADQYRREVIVTSSPAGPTIDGPRAVTLGSTGTWTADVPADETFYWIHPTAGQVFTSEISIVVTEDFALGVISVDSDGVERGDQILVTSE